MPACFSPYMQQEPNADTLRQLVEAAGGQCILVPASPFLLPQSQTPAGGQSRRGSQQSYQSQGSTGSTGSQTAAAEMELAITDLLHSASELLQVAPRPLATAMQQLARGVPLADQPAMQVPEGSARPYFDDCRCLVLAGSGPSGASVGGGSDQLRAMQRQSGWPLVAPAWLIDTLSAFQRQPLQRYLLFRPDPATQSQAQ